MEKTAVEGRNFHLVVAAEPVAAIAAEIRLHHNILSTKLPNDGQFQQHRIFHKAF